jgi:hypothetical protein
MGLSYLKDPILNPHLFTNVKINQNSNSNKKQIGQEYKKKYKTEKCKFWEINKTCKFSENVKKNN